MTIEPKAIKKKSLRARNPRNDHPSDETSAVPPSRSTEPRSRCGARFARPRSSSFSPPPSGSGLGVRGLPRAARDRAALGRDWRDAARPRRRLDAGPGLGVGARGEVVRMFETAFGRDRDMCFGDRRATEARARDIRAGARDRALHRLAPQHGAAQRQTFGELETRAAQRRSRRLQARRGLRGERGGAQSARCGPPDGTQWRAR